VSSKRPANRPVEILLVEDSPSDTELTREALRETSQHHHLSTIDNGEDALRFLHRQPPYADAPRPDYILLDLSLPRKSGHEILAEMRQDPSLRAIPVVVLTASADHADLKRAYAGHANCYITKPFDAPKFMNVIRSIEVFWRRCARLPDPASAANWSLTPYFPGAAPPAQPQ
jgi:two-component system, chemotaxis family, response regulator Rcp1